MRLVTFGMRAAVLLGGLAAGTAIAVAYLLG